MVNLFYKNHSNKLIAIFLYINSGLSIAINIFLLNINRNQKKNQLIINM